MFDNIIAATAIAFSFLTVLPAPRAEWTPPRLRRVPAVLPLVGLAVGLLGAGTFSILSRWQVSPVLRAALMALFYPAVTGGLHMDGLMDTCDAIFSRRDRETRLRILSDTHTGAFAVMGCAAVLLLKTGIFTELFAVPLEKGLPLKMLLLVPVYSRIGLGILFYMPFAKEDGLARTLGSARVFRDRYVLIVLYALLSLPLLPLFAGGGWFAVSLAGLAFLLLWSQYCRRSFGGVTGDLMGAYLELSETLMLLTLVASR